MADLSWLQQEARTLHALFTNMFYSLALVLMLLGVVTEYFKVSIGGMPQFAQLAGRFLVAAILLNSYSEVSNLIADVTDALANQIGSLSNIKLVLTKYWEKLQSLQVSWTSIKDSVLMLISFVTFFILYISVYIADAAITYAWVLLYVFSPILIALCVLPGTSSATKALYRSLFEVGAWKIVWSVLSTLLWSSALSQINNPGSSVNFITAVSLNLILAASLLLTPFVVNALAGAGIASLAGQTTGLAAGAVAFSPGHLLTNFAKKKRGGSSNEDDLSSGSQDDGNDPNSPPPTDFSKFQSKFKNFGNLNTGFNSSSGSSSPPPPKTSPPPSTRADSAAKASNSQNATARSSNRFSSSYSANLNSSGNEPRPQTTTIRQPAGTQGSEQATSTQTHAAFKAPVKGYEPQASRPEYQKRPIQQSLFNDSQNPPTKNK